MKKITQFLPDYTLLKQLVITDFKLRYQGSLLGYVWSLFKPMMMFGILYFIFTYVIPTGKDVPHFPAYLLLGIVIWTFFTESTSMSLASIVSRGDLIRKVNISKYAIVLSSVISAGVNLLLNSVVVLIFMIFSGVDIWWHMLPWLPLLLIELIALSVGFSYLLAALYVKFRDFSPIWEIILQIMFYATPIIYPLTLAAQASEKIVKVLSINPLAQIIQDFRSILITPETLTTHTVLGNGLSSLVSIIIVVIVLVAGIYYFTAKQRYFVEEL